jgi:transposase
VLTLPPSVRIYLAVDKVDMRCGHDGLGAIVRNQWRLDIFEGHLFVFVGRKGDRVKILFWDATIATLHIPEAIANERRSRYRSIRSVASLLR